MGQLTFYTIGGIDKGGINAVTHPLCGLSKLAPSLEPVEYEELNWKTHLGDITDSPFLDLLAECNEIFVRSWPVIGKSISVQVLYYNKNLK